MSAEPIPEQDAVPPAQPVEPLTTPVEPSADEVPSTAESEVPSTAETATADASAAASAATAAVVATPDTTAAPTVPVEPVVATSDTAAVIRPSARVRALAVARRVLSFALMASLLVLGIALGYSTFVVNQPAAPVVGDPATRDVPTPSSVEEFVVALRLDDEDAIRAALPPDPYKQYTAEMQNWNFQEVTSVETLSTFADGPRAATQLVLVGLNTDGLPVTINLTIVTDGGAIVMFR